MQSSNDEVGTDYVRKSNGYKRRLWLFRATVLIAICAAFFLLLEFSLRLSGFGYPASFFLKTTIKDQAVRVDNERFAWRFFPKQIARYPIPFSLPEVKPKDTYRIFILGASAALGAPNHAFGFGRILDVFLRHHFPGVRFEVVTACMVASNSHVSLEVARDCAELQPDLFIAYMGNNEVVGPFGAGTIFSPLASNLSVIRAGLTFQSTRIGQLLAAVLGSKTRASELRTWDGMTMFLESQVRHDDPAIEIVYQHFQTNLADICRVAMDANVPIAVCTVATNLKDCAPFASLHRSDLTTAQKAQWQRLYQQAEEFESKGDYSRASAVLLEASAIDDSYAELHYRLGRCYWSLQLYEKARQSFVQAREYDTLRFRADTRINETIRAEVEGREDEGVYLLNLEKVVSENSPHSIPGEEFFHEHVHLKFEGNFLLAKTLFHRIKSLLPDWIARKTAEGVPPLTSEECAKRLAFTDWEKKNGIEKMLNAFIKKPPFTNQLNNSHQAAAMEKQLELLNETFKAPSFKQDTDRQYQEGLASRDGDVWIRQNYGRFLEVFDKDYAASEVQKRLVVGTFPHNPVFQGELGRTVRIRGKYGEAKVLLERALQIRPETLDFLVQLGITLTELGDKTGAIRAFEQAIEVDPTSVEAHYNFAMAKIIKWGQLAEAVGDFREVIRLAPEDVLAQSQLGQLYAKLKRFPEALQQYREAIGIQPDFVQAHFGLGMTHLTMGNTAGAMLSLRKLGKLDAKMAQQLSEQILARNPQMKNRINMGSRP